MQKLILALITMLFSIGVVFAQSQPVSEDFPLYIEGALKSGEDLYEFVIYRYVDAEWEQLPLQDFSEGSLSPDGQWLAYTRTPPFLKALIESGEDGASGTSYDIALVNLQDGTERMIAVQPSTIRVTKAGYTDGIKRSPPVWSPDGSALAWTEQDYAPPRSTRRLVVYDLETQESRILDTDLPGVNYSSDGMPYNFSWGAPGIAVFGNDGPDSMPSVRLYDPQQGLQYAVILPFDEGPFGLYGPFWVGETPSQTDGDLAMIQTYQEQWYQVDPATGGAAPMQRQLEMVSATTPTESLRVLWNIYKEEGVPEWQLLAADGTTQIALDTAPLFAFSPSGQAVAYMRDGILSVWQDGEATEIALPEGFSVGALHWGQTRYLAGHDTGRPAPRQGGGEAAG
jgi:hypothetical protein